MPDGVNIYDNLGITINLTEMSETKEYVEYYLGRNWLMRYLLRIFKWNKVKELRFQIQCALLNAVLEEGGEVIMWDDD